MQTNNAYLVYSTRYANKKISALSFSHNGEWLLYADKFGVVYVVSTRSDEHTALHDKSVQLLAHCCSIITSVVHLSPNLISCVLLPHL